LHPILMKMNGYIWSRVWNDLPAS